MGCGLPELWHQKLHIQIDKLIAIAGDGAFQMVMQDFATVVQYTDFNCICT